MINMRNGYLTIPHFRNVLLFIIGIISFFKRMCLVTSLALQVHMHCTRTVYKHMYTKMVTLYVFSGTYFCVGTRRQHLHKEITNWKWLISCGCNNKKSRKSIFVFIYSCIYVLKYMYVMCIWLLLLLGILFIIYYLSINPEQK